MKLIQYLTKVAFYAFNLLWFQSRHKTWTILYQNRNNDTYQLLITTMRHWPCWNRNLLSMHLNMPEVADLNGNHRAGNDRVTNTTEYKWSAAYWLCWRVKTAADIWPCIAFFTSALPSKTLQKWRNGIKVLIYKSVSNCQQILNI